MVWSYFPYIVIPELPGDVKADAAAFLWANDQPQTLKHVAAVAEMNIKIAGRYGLDKQICELSGYLHDISAAAAPADMLTFAAENHWRIDQSEKSYPFLLHQRLAKVIAKEHFGVADERILSAIECHTTLKASPSAYDMALFVADKLAWDQNGRPPFYSAVKKALDESLELASLTYMEYIVTNKMILQPHEWFLSAFEFLRKKTAQA